MNALNKSNKDASQDKDILIAVDGSENAKRAVIYVADFLRGIPGFHVTLLNIVSEPPEDYFSNNQEHKKWIEEHQEIAQQMLEDYRVILMQGGFKEEAIEAKVVMKSCFSIAECILSERTKHNSSAVVVGRRGISKKEEFLFGSTSNKILHEAKDCSVWVIE